MTACNGRCETMERAHKLQREARRQLRLAAPGSREITFLLGFLRALDLLEDDDIPTERMPVRAVVSGAVCALPAEGQQPCPS